MRALAKRFRQHGFDFKQLMRDGRVALFVKTKPQFARESHEVVIVQRIKERTICGRRVEAHEAMPSPEQWGVAGWTFTDLEKAKAKFNQLAANQQIRQASFLAFEAPA
jgi:hypothetical protein